MVRITGIVAAIVSVLSPIGFAQSISQPSQLSGWTDLSACVTNALVGNGYEEGITVNVGCQNYVCACDNAGSGFVVSEMASLYCGDSSDGATAASVWHEFCSQLDGGSIPTSPIFPAATPSGLPINTLFTSTNTAPPPTSSANTVPPPTSPTGTILRLSQPSQLPGWTSLRACVTNAVVGDNIDEGILQYIGCQDYSCACNDAGSEATLSEVASMYCSDSAAAATATSVWNLFCSIFLGATGRSPAYIRHDC